MPDANDQDMQLNAIYVVVRGGELVAEGEQVQFIGTYLRGIASEFKLFRRNGLIMELFPSTVRRLNQDETADIDRDGNSIDRESATSPAVTADQPEINAVLIECDPVELLPQVEPIARLANDLVRPALINITIDTRPLPTYQG